MQNNQSQQQVSLVTGAAGFLGSHLVDRLLAEGRQVVGFDNLQTGSMKNLDHLRQTPAFKFIKGDVIEGLPDVKADEVFNLACAASPPRYQEDPIHTFKTNIIGMMHVLDFARANNARVLQASTSEVYGNPLEHPQPETYFGNVNTIGIRACYDEGKRGAETLCYDYKRMHYVDVRVVRIFNTYGPRMDPEDGRVVTNLIMQGLKRSQYSLFGGGHQTRSFCYVDDLLDGIMGTMRLAQNPGAPVNIGNPVEFTIVELAGLVQELTGHFGKIQVMPMPADDPAKRRPDITRAHTLFGFEPKIALREGLERTIDHFKNR